MTLQRGALVTVALQGDYGKPRPALVIQSDLFEDTSSITLALLSSARIDAPLLRVTIEPDAGNGLAKVSQIMIDKLVTVPRTKVGHPFGKVSPSSMTEVNRALLVFLGLA